MLGGGHHPDAEASCDDSVMEAPRDDISELHFETETAVTDPVTEASRDDIIQEEHRDDISDHHLETEPAMTDSFAEISRARTAPAGE